MSRAAPRRTARPLAGPPLAGLSLAGPPLAAVALWALLLAGCSGPILANPALEDAPSPATVPSTPATPSTPSAPSAATTADPQPVELPRDDAPHDRLTEWWYYTGHLAAEDGRTFGFEFVVFRAERGSFPVAWASHLAVTDEVGDRFAYDQRSEVGGQVDRSAESPGFDLAVSGDLLPGLRGPGPAWSMSGTLGQHRLDAPGGRADDGSAIGIELDLDDGARAPILHDGDGYVDFGPAGGSYYLSRPRMEAAGTLTLGDERLAVSGTAWFDHQWGDFISVGGGGWDWFAINLADGTDLTLSLVRDAKGEYPLIYGTLRDADGTDRHLDAADIEVDVTAEWTSERTGATWPAGWRVRLPTEGLIVDLRPTVAGQELDTRETTGVAYWEGSQVVSATRDGMPLEGEAYVELTGYGPGITGAEG